MEREELVNLTDARVKFSEMIRDASGRVQLILRWGKPVAAVLSYDQYREMLEQIEDLEDRIAIFEAREEPFEDRLTLDKVKAEAGLLD